MISFAVGVCVTLIRGAYGALSGVALPFGLHTGPPVFSRTKEVQKTKHWMLSSGAAADLLSCPAPPFHLFDLFT